MLSLASAAYAAAVAIPADYPAVLDSPTDSAFVVALAAV